MPRTAKVNGKTILNCLTTFPIFDENKQLKSRSNDVWKEAAKEINNITSDTLNFNVRNDRWGLLRDLKEFFGIAHVDVSVNEVSINTTINNNEDDEFVPYNNRNCSTAKSHPLIFDITLSEEEWNSIKPIHQSVGHSYVELQSGWTDVIAKACFLKAKLSCSFSFKYAKICEASESKAYLNISGSCKECGADFRAFSLFEPTPGDGINLRVHTVDSTGIPHKRKRHVKGNARLNMGKALLLKKPRLFRNEAVADFSFNDPEPPFLPKKATLRKIKEEAVNLDLGVNNNIHPVDSLLQLKYKHKYSGYIKDLAVDQFYVFYWSPMQMTMYKELIRITHKIEIDATGSLVKSIPKNNGDKVPVFLYQIVLKGYDSIQPVFQMLSGKHDTNTICYWLREIIRHGAPIPPESDCDYSLALLNATSLAFNERRLHTYIADCYRWLSFETLQHLLKTCIRVDIAHLIKIVCFKKIFSHKLPKVKDFYMRCIGVMSTCKTVSSFETLLLSTIVVASSEYTGNDAGGNNVPCAEKHAFLIQRIKTFTYEDNENYLDRQYDHLDDDLDQDDILNIIRNIHNTALTFVAETGETEFLNPFYCPEIVPHLLKLAKHFPIWTNVMSAYFPLSSSVASSARCESYFKDLKHTDLGSDYQPLRADKFVIKHVKSIENISKIERAAGKLKKEERAVNQFETKREKLISKSKVLDSAWSTSPTQDLLQVENWRGLNNAERKVPTYSFIESDEDKENVIKSRTNIIDKSESPLEELQQSGVRGKYLRPCPQLELMYDRPLRRKKNNILHNGNLCSPVIIDKKNYIQNTCGFDSIAELMTSCYSNFIAFKKLVDNSVETLFFSFIQKYAQDGVTKALYRERANILSVLYDNKNNFIDCFGGVYDLINKLIIDTPCLKLLQECETCGTVSKSQTIVVCDANFSEFRFKDCLEKFIINTCQDEIQKCKNCKSEVKILKECSAFLCFDLDIVFQLGEEKIINGIKLSEIPEEIETPQKKFMLGGLISHVPGHFVAFSRHVTGTWLKHDDLSRKTCSINNNVLLKPIIVVYVQC